MKVALFFSCGISLADWKNSGLLGREKKIYEGLLEKKYVDSVIWFTYGALDSRLSEKLYYSGELHNKIRIVPMPALFSGKIGEIIYSFLAPFIHRKIITQCDVIKSNQLSGAWTAWLAAFIFRKKFFFRTGYTYSELAKAKHDHRLIKNILFYWIEKFLYHYSTVSSVSSYHSLNYVRQVHSAKNAIYLPNFIDTDHFTPKNSKKIKNAIVFVGRLHKEKNLSSFILAMQNTQYQLHIYGSGKEEKYLKYIAEEKNIPVFFHGSVSNEELPNILSRYRYFILPSTFEGMPKALLEAMACGCTCLGADVPGINEVIINKSTGILAQKADIKNFHLMLLQLENIDCTSLSQKGIQYIQEVYSLSSLIEKEANILNSLLNK